MKIKGSVLIVVLGLLAILAVIGITFVTMSSIDRSTAANFALQTQFDLAADGAVEFACHALVQDLWELKPDRTYSSLLMSGSVTNKNEPWDAPGKDVPTTDDDNWLASTIEPAAAGTTPKNLSFGGPSPLPYTIPFRGTAASISTIIDAPDNLGTGLTPTPKNGIWLPELAFPYEAGLIRTSITIQDHASLINLNAHGNTGVANSWPLADLVGWGYFISDVNPDPASDGKVNMTRLLVGDTSSRPGRWGPNKRAPGNPNIGEILFENPAAAVNMDGTAITDPTKGDYPLNLDEEFDLRRIPKDTDPKFSSRISGGSGSNAIISLLGDPKQRLAYTTVGWTSEARGDRDTHLAASDGNSTEGAWSARKADLNFDTPTAIYKALYCGRTCPANSGNTWGGQFAANVAGFRDGSTGCGIKGYDLGSAPTCVAASRQPILSKVSAQSVSNGSGGNDWTISIQLVSPWGSDTALQTGNPGLTTTGMKVQVNGTDVGTLPSPMLAPTVIVTVPPIGGGASTSLTAALNSLTLVYQPPGQGNVILDQLESDDIAKLSDKGSIYRPIYTELEPRGTNPPPNTETTVLYVGPWVDNAGNNTKDKTSGIPIRFPRSVPQSVDGLGTDPNASNLPPRAPAAGSPFKAIARLGDIDQILCPNTDPAVTGNKGSGDFWPWVPRVAKAMVNANTDAEKLKSESNQKFNWDDTMQPGGTNVSRLNAANVLAVGGPWQDKIDNDGDGKMDNQDAGTGNTATDLGRFAGPELRVAGKVNLNTATTLTFQAMESGLQLPQGCLSSLAANPRRIFRSIAEVRSTLPTLTDNQNARGPLEQRDEAFNRISNIASVRSDTYSIYGTVQYGTIEKSKTFKVLRSRRFWALVDRSPSLAYSPLTSNFAHPRILNFQWLN
jgi:hypothetical protein